VRFGVTERLRAADGVAHAAARRFYLREHGVRRAVEDRVDGDHAIAGEAVADRAHDRHGAADSSLEAQLSSLPCGERRKRGAVPGNHLLIGGDDGFAGSEDGTNPVGGRLNAANRLDDDVGVALEDLGNLRRPGDTVQTGMRTLLLRAAIEDL